jgi:hypothetical protein
MSDSATSTEIDWHPFTPRGVAGASLASRWQLWVVLGVTAVLSTLMLLFFLTTCWTPVIREAIDRLPDGGYVRGGMYYPGGTTSDLLLAENRFLSAALRWRERPAQDHAADVRLTLQIDGLHACSLFGCAVISYHSFGNVPLGRTETGAWWRAWHPAFLAAAVVIHLFVLVIVWWLLAVFHGWAIRMLGFYLDRQIDFAGAARVAQAALVPGALWLTAALFFYTQGWLNLYGLIVVIVMHVPVGWVYAAAACWAGDRCSSSRATTGRSPRAASRT